MIFNKEMSNVNIFMFILWKSDFFCNFALQIVIRMIFLLKGI